MAALTPYVLKLAAKLTERTANKLSTIEVHPGINVVVGPNGSGKSTILRGFHEKQVEVPNGTHFGIRYFDTEKMNPRIQAHIMEGGLGGFQINSYFRSHGQIMKPIMLAWNQGLEKGPHVIILDEPEAGLDLDAKLEVIEGMKKAPPRIRFLLATHDALFLRAASAIIELVPGYADKLRAAYA